MSEDKNVNLLEGNFNIVISSGALKCLLDDDGNEWNVPVVVKKFPENNGFDFDISFYVFDFLYFF